LGRIHPATGFLIARNANPSKRWLSKSFFTRDDLCGYVCVTNSNRFAATNRTTDRRAEAGSKEIASCVIAMLDSSWAATPAIAAPFCATSLPRLF
jgi:hypothetical protein